jgi:hypothetical protein
MPRPRLLAVIVVIVTVVQALEPPEQAPETGPP